MMSNNKHVNVQNLKIESTGHAKAAMYAVTGHAKAAMYAVALVITLARR